MGCECRNLTKRETNCTDTVDNDGDSRVDCLDSPDCDGTSCGMGCTCTAGAKQETNCTDRLDNDADGLRDCADTMNCSGAAGCASGGACASDEFGTFCRQACSGSGSSACRQGYACEDDDLDSSTPRACVPLCTADADCARQGGNYGCNPWSKRCESKDKGLSKYGAGCSSHAQCETGRCISGSGGYCEGRCLKAGGTCGGDGVCGGDGSSDSTGRCFDGCAASNECRSSPYSCRAPPYGGTGTVCYCSREGESCSSNGDCCGGFCFPGIGICPL